jgi:hypothetical protein
MALVLLLGILGFQVLPASASAADQLAITFQPTRARAGQSFQIYVEAIDPMSGSNDTGYAGTVHIASSDGAATLPPDATLPFGIGTFDVTLNSEGQQTLTATDNAGSSPDTSDPIKTIAATGFSLSVPSVVTSSMPFSYTVTALAANGQTDSGYIGTAVISPNDDDHFRLGASTLTAGTKTLTGTLYGNGQATITARDADFPAIKGTSSPVTILPFHSFSIEKEKRDLGHGIVVLTMGSDQGGFEMRGRKVRPDSTYYLPPGPTNRLSGGKLTLRARGRARRKLLETGRVKVGIHITYQPTHGLPETRFFPILLQKDLSE